MIIKTTIKGTYYTGISNIILIYEYSSRYDVSNVIDDEVPNVLLEYLYHVFICTYRHVLGKVYDLIIL